MGRSGWGGGGEEERPVSEIRAATVLPAKRTPVTLPTADGLRLVGELALPADADPVGTLIWLHPLPTHGGMMDSHLLKKAAFRLPALAQLAVLRFNTRGTSSWQGTSEGEFDAGEAERHDVSAAVTWAVDAGLPGRWLVGWSFGTELALKWGLDADASAPGAKTPDAKTPDASASGASAPAPGRGIEGAILLSPPLRRAGDADLDRWAASGKPLLALVPEFDDYLRPDDARVRFARVPQAEVVAAEGAKHLWVGERYTRVGPNEIVRRVNPAAWPLPTAVDPALVATSDTTSSDTTSSDTTSSDTTS